MIKFSFLLVSKNRKTDLNKTLSFLYSLVSDEIEILVFLDGCSDNTIELKNIFPKVEFLISHKSLGASAARNILYKQSKGLYLIGLDDDSHPITSNFLDRIEIKFNESPKTAILAFRLFWGQKNLTHLNNDSRKWESYEVSEFAGCGFAIRRSAYFESGGFPKWLSIYGEELYLSLSIYNLGYLIEYFPEVLFQHRVDRQARKEKKRIRYWFKNQLENMILIHLLVFPKRVIFPRFFRFLFHNFTKYGLKSIGFFSLYFFVFFKSILKIPFLLFSVKRMSFNKFVLWNALPLPVFYWKE